MKQLSGLDATFLYLETPETPMHVGSLHLYELPEGFKGSFHAQVRRHMAGRVHLSPIFTRKLALMPLNLGHPQWVDDEAFDIDWHIVKIGKTVKGKAVTESMAQDMAADLHGQLIDRSRPLWMFYVFDSIVLANGQRCAGFYSKIHHAALDGKGGTALANAVLDVGPVPRQVAPPDPNATRTTQADLKIGEMIGAVFSNSLAQYAKLAKSLPGVASQLGSSLAKNALQVTASAKGANKLQTKSPLRLAPQTLFNVGISAERVFVTASLPFADCRHMAKSIGASLNDIVLWICSTALRTYLAQHASIPKKPLVAAMPVSLREDSNKDMGNQASMSLVDLGTHLAHPMKRMNAIMASTSKVKEALVSLKSVLPTDYPGLLAPWLVGGAARLALKAYGSAGIAERLPLLANVVISNVPGPQMPLYLAGARMLTFHPLSIVVHGLGLNITIQTYAGRVDFGIIAGKNALPHPQDLADAIGNAFEEAQHLYAMAPSQSPAATPVSGAFSLVKTPVSGVTKKRGATSKSIAPKTATLVTKRRTNPVRVRQQKA